MKVTYNWLNDFVDIKIPAQELAEKMTMAGLEVTSLEQVAGDWVLEIEVTSNRPDWLSVSGVAREVSAITGKKFKALQLPKHLTPNTKHLTPNTQQQNFSIKIEDKKDCPLYTARIIQGLKVGQSPDWLRQRLELVGCRSVNSIVDITNYVLFEYGEPLHAFDLDKLQGQGVIVRKAKDGERLITIDGKSHVLDADILVIADRNQAVAVAGIMGGLDTEVSSRTKNILLEAAIFDPLVIRRARQKLGMQSESAYRFERGINPEIVETASLRAAGLIEEISAGKCILAKNSPLPRPKKTIVRLDLERAKRILGVNITAAKAEGILKHLGFKLASKGKNIFLVDVPAHRSDVELEEDLIEEISRIFGYGNIPTTLPAAKMRIIADDTQGFISLVKNILVGLGLNEVVTYSLVSRDLIDKLNLNKEAEIEILNPLSKEQEILRPALAPSLLDCVSRNLNHNQDYVNIFEVAKVFLKAHGHPRESLNLAIALCGTRQWLFEQGLIKDKVGILHLKGIVETLLVRLGIKEYVFRAGNNASAIGVYLGAEQLGSIFMLEKNLSEKFEIKNKEVVLVELSLDRLFSRVNLQKKFVPLPLYPGISRDISFLVRDNLKTEEIIQAVQGKGRPWLKETKVTDYYKGKQIPAGYKGLTISCFYRSDERTLTEGEINPLHSALTAMLQEKFGGQIR